MIDPMEQRVLLPPKFPIQQISLHKILPKGWDHPGKTQSPSKLKP